jgi:hypothetical protein
MVQDGRGGGIPAAGELLSLLRKEFRVFDIFSGGRNATAPTSGTVPPPLKAGFIRF